MRFYMHVTHSILLIARYWLLDWLVRVNTLKMELELYREKMHNFGAMPSTMSRNTSNPGEVLIKVQEDLKQLKERLILTAATGSSSGAGFDISTLENAIAHTEQAIMVCLESI